MDKKYELMPKDETTNLHRIRALRSFGNVKAGDIGGFVAGEDNLSHLDNCWVYGAARVFENARVFERARVYGDARVFGDAQVFNNALVYGNARVYEDVRISGYIDMDRTSKLVTNIIGSTFPVTILDKVVHIGCVCLTTKEWIEQYREIGEKKGFTPEQIEEYRGYIRLAVYLQSGK